MDDKFKVGSLPTYFNYSSRLLPYIIILVLAKFLRSFGIYLLYDLLKIVNHVQILFLIQFCTAIFLIFFQKPFSGRKLLKFQYFRIARHAFFSIGLKLLWLYGLTLCGPLRTLLLFEHSDVIVLAALSALFTSASTPSKFRGAMFFIGGYLFTMLFDHDFHKRNIETGLAKERHESLLSHIFNHITNLTGLSDHKAGVCLLFITLCLTTLFNMASKNLSLDIGGSKRLNALSTTVSLVFLAPWSLFLSYTSEVMVESWMSFISPIIIISLFLFVIDFYVESVSLARLESTKTIQISCAAILASSLLISFFWNHPFVGQITNTNHLKVLIAEDHEISAGVFISLILFAFAVFILMKPTRVNRGNFVGYSTTGPLYNYTGDAFQKTSNSLFMILKNGLHKILEGSDSRKIFYFLCVNLSFTFVELIYGVWTNSLGLISDGFHMFFDCSALVMGLYAAVMTQWKATRIFSYGFDRVEILSGFINAIFLIVIAFFVFIAAFSRLIDPPDINTERLLFVSVGGLLVNLIGITAFRHSHTHGGISCSSANTSQISSTSNHQHSHSHGEKHGHSHSTSHGHSHGTGHSDCSQDHIQLPVTNQVHNTNMEGVFLHILADTLGSVGVIISTLLIQTFGWKIADPICSIFISVLIFLSVLPLVKETSFILLLKTPVETQANLARVLQKLSSMEEILGYNNERFWRHSSSVLCGSIHIKIKHDVIEQIIISQITSMFKDIGYNNLCIQLEKPLFFQHLSGLGINENNLRFSNQYNFR